MAPLIGLEPMTDWLTASRSTYLSYSGPNSAYVFTFAAYLSLVVHATASPHAPFRSFRLEKCILPILQLG